MTPDKKHHIELDSEERDLLGKVAGKRKAAAVRVQRAKAMLAMDRGAGGSTMTDKEVSVLSLHFTQKHGSWLNMAEIEISVLSRCALKGRIGDVQTFREAIAKDSMRRNQSARPIHWQFTTTDARQKWSRLYPSF